MKEQKTLGLSTQTAEEQRDAALVKVAETKAQWFIDANNVATEALREFRGKTWTGEALRLITYETVGEPHHANAWGAVIMHLLRQGVIEATGEHRKMQGPKSHARKTPVYKVME